MTLHPDIERVALLGWCLAPMARRSRKGLWKGYIDDATHDLDTLERWQHGHPNCNWAVVPAKSGVWALDVDIAGPDHDNDGVAALRDLCALHGPLPDRPHGRSGGGGHLLVFRSTGPITPGSGKPAPGLDACAKRSTFTISPSRHRRTGDAYRWVVAPWDVAPPPAPEWLARLLAPPPPPARPARPLVPTGDAAMRALMRSFDAAASAPAGQRNQALHKRAVLIGGFVGAGAMDRATAERELIAAGMRAGQSRSEATSTVRSGLNAGEQRPIEWRAA